jgi:hypothetical protein
MARTGLTAAVLALLAAAAFAPSGAASEPAGSGRALGDTLTVIMRPILSVPAITVPDGSFTIEAVAPESTTGWTASIARGGSSHALTVDSASYDPAHERWFLTATVPPGVPEEVYALEVSTAGEIFDEAEHAVSVRQSMESDFYFVHITDTHLPTHLYYYQEGADTDTSEMMDLRMVINDINIINPAFVLLTGDVVNEGELEDYLDKRYYTRAQRILQELDVPVYLSAGNHDIGGWDDTPPSDGTARRNWWKFFGWPYLDDPPSADIYTQNYSFDYGGTHFIALEAYNNYDRWRRSIYGSDSFTSRQLNWLYGDIAAVPAGVPTVAFYHSDFQNQLNIEGLGLDGVLRGHVHYSSGEESNQPFDLSTESVCDGERAMRLVRVSGQTVTPRPHIDTGTIGQRLSVAYDAPNNGTATENTATVTNAHSETFEHARVRFMMDAAAAPYQVDGGDMAQTIVEDGVAVCYVNVSLPPLSNTDVTITPDTSAGVGEAEAAVLALVGPAHPNPAGRESTISFTTGRPGHVTVAVYDVSGRLVDRVLDAHVGAGPHSVSWNTRRPGGAEAPAGVYLYRVSMDDESVSGKLVVVR